MTEDKEEEKILYKKINKKKILLIIGISMIFLIPYVYSLFVGFVNPTPPNLAFVYESSGVINFTIDQGANPIDNINWTWNNTNFTFAGDDLLFMVDFKTLNNLQYNIEDITSQEGEAGTLTTGGVEGVWHFNYRGTSVIYDDSANGYNATLRGGAAFNIINKKYGNAGIEFDGVDDNIDTNVVGNLIGTSNGFTTGAWVYMKGGSGGAFDLEAIISNFRTTLGVHHGYVLDCFSYNVGADTAVCRFRFGDGTSTIPVTPNVAINGHEWVYVVGVYNSTTVAIFINGELAGSTVHGTTYTATSVHDTLIGSLIQSPTYTWNGTIDEVFFLDRPLLGGEVKLIYENQWKLRTHIEGKYDDAYYPFQLSKLTYPYAGNIDNNSGSIEMWVKPSWDLEIGAPRYLFDMRPGGDNANRVILYKAGGNGNLNFIIYDGAISYRILTGGVGTANFENEWNHIVATWNSTDPKELYLNGVLIDGIVSGAGTGNFAESSIFYLGSLIGGTSSRAIIDEVRIYNHTMNQVEVMEHYYGNLKATNSTSWRFLTNHSDLVLGNTYTYQGCATDNVGNLNCTETRSLTYSSNITDCTDITTAGTYALTKNITATDGADDQCIDIQANNVILDCQGYTIDGDDLVDDAISITRGTPTSTNITVRHCKIRDFDTNAIALDYANNNTFTNITLESNTDYGLKLYRSASNKVIDLNASDNGAGFYFQDTTTRYNTITNSTITSSNSYGMWLRAAQDNTFYNNIFNNSKDIRKVGFNDYNEWNITETVGINIIGGANIGGNYWGNPNGNGFSDTCVDVTPNDGFCDSDNTIATNNIDYLPLTTFVDTVPPSLVIIYSPRNNSFINGEVTIVAEATDNIGIDNVTFPWKNVSDNGEICVDFSSPYSCNWNTDDYAESIMYYVNITAYDYWTNTNSSEYTYMIDRTIPIMNNPRTIYQGGKTSARDSQTVTYRVGMIDSPTQGAGSNLTQMGLTNLNGTGNATMILWAGGLGNDVWSNWTIDVIINTGTTTISPNAESIIYGYDNSTPNNLNSGYAFNTKIDNTLPYHINSTYGHTPDTPYINEEIYFYVNDVRDNYELDYFIFSNNFSGTWQNSSVVSIANISCGSEMCGSAFNTTMMGITNGSYQFFIFDDAGNQNETEKRDVGLFGERPTLTVYHSTPADTSTVSSPVNVSFTYNNSMADNCTLWLDDGVVESPTENYTWFYPLNSSETQHNYGFSQELGTGNYEWKVDCVENVTHTIYPQSSVPWTFTVSGAADTCTCAGINTNWEIDMSDFCVLDTTCDLGTGTLSFINAGWFNCDARFDYAKLIRSDTGIFWENDSCMRFEG